MKTLKFRLCAFVLLILVHICAFAQNGVMFLSYGIDGREYPRYFNKEQVFSSFGQPIVNEHILLECGSSLPFYPESDWEKRDDLNIWLLKYKFVVFETNLKQAAVYSLDLRSEKNYIKFDKFLVNKRTTLQRLLKQGGRVVAKNTVFFMDRNSDDGSGFVFTIKKGQVVAVKPLNAC